MQDPDPKKKKEDVRSKKQDEEKITTVSVSTEFREIKIGQTKFKVQSKLGEALPFQFTKLPGCYLCLAPVPKTEEQEKETLSLSFGLSSCASSSSSEAYEISFEGKLLAFAVPPFHQEVVLHKPKLSKWQKEMKTGKKENNLTLTIFAKISLEKEKEKEKQKKEELYPSAAAVWDREHPQKLEILFVNREEFEHPEPIYVTEFVAECVARIRTWDFKSPQKNQWLKQIVSLYTEKLEDCAFYLDRIYPPSSWPFTLEDGIEKKPAFFIRKCCVSDETLESLNHNYTVVQLPFVCFLLCLPVKGENQKVVKQYFQDRIQQEIGPYDFSPSCMFHRWGGLYEKTRRVDEKLFEQGSLEEVYINSNKEHTDFEIEFHFFGGGYNPYSLEQIVKSNPQLPWSELVSPTEKSLLEPNYFIKRFSETIRRGTIGGCIFYSALSHFLSQLKTECQEKEKENPSAMIVE